MSRKKHSLGKIIEPSDPHEKQWAMALLGDLKDYSSLNEAICTLREECEISSFQIGSSESGKMVEARRAIEKFVIDAIESGTPSEIHKLAELLEIVIKGKPVSELEAFMLLLRDNHANWEARNAIGTAEPEESDFWYGWPFTLTKISTLFSESQKSRVGSDSEFSSRTTNEIKQAAQRVGLAYTCKLGRPRGLKPSAEK
jgi:hypothetical protein